MASRPVLLKEEAIARRSADNHRRRSITCHPLHPNPQPMSATQIAGKEASKAAQKEKEGAAHAKKVAQKDKQWAVGAKDDSKSVEETAKAAEKAAKQAEKAALIKAEGGDAPVVNTGGGPVMTR
jgi:hypothetical protein